MKTLKHDIGKLILLVIVYILGIVSCLFCLYSPYVEFSNEKIQLEQQSAKTAFEARTESIQPQLENIKEEIKIRSNQGEVKLHLKYIPLPEVIEVLVSEGYNIEAHTNNGFEYSEISWQFAEEKEGKFNTIID